MRASSVCREAVEWSCTAEWSCMWLLFTGSTPLHVIQLQPSTLGCAGVAAMKAGVAT